MEAIVKWLEDKDYQEGVRLYEDHGSSEFLKKIFNNGESDYSRKKLEEELLSLLSEGFKITSKPVFKKVNYDPDQSKLNGVDLDVIYIDEAVDIPYEENKPSSQDNINYLKLTRRRDELNRQISRNMVLLDVSTSKKRRYETAKQIISLDRAKRQVWAEIDYFLEHGSIMPVAVKPEIKTDELQRLYVQIYKAEKRLEKTELRNRAKTEKLLAEKRKRVEEIRKERSGE